MYLNDHCRREPKIWIVRGHPRYYERTCLLPRVYRHYGTCCGRMLQQRNMHPEG